MSTPPPSTRAIEISGISVNLTDHPEHALLVTMRVDGASPASLVVKRQDPLVGDYPLEQPIFLREGPTLTVQIKRTHRIRPSKTLAHVNLDLDNISSQERGEDNTPVNKYRVNLPSPRQEIWLNFATYASMPRTTTNKGTYEDNGTKFRELEDLKTRLGGIPDIKPRARPCIEGTRTGILSEVERTIADIEDTNAIWISGAPGSGKSSVSLTIKSRLHKQGRLLTYFRFDRNDSSTTTPLALWSRVAYDLADRYPLVRKRHLSLLHCNEVDLTSTIELFTLLVEEPLSKSIDTPPDHPLVVVIDALDECGGLEGSSSSSREDLLRTLARVPHAPKYFKVVMTSREEGDIHRVLSSITTRIYIPSGKFLTDNPDDRASLSASEDILSFLEDRFQRIREPFKSSLPRDWPGRDMIACMVGRAAGNFMWATAATGFIQSGPPQNQLDSIMIDPPETESMRPLYFLYSTILEVSFGNLMGKDSQAEVIRAVLGTMVLARRPLEDDEYVKLPTDNPVEMDMIGFIRERLRSVLSSSSALRFEHKSFDDFLLSEECPPKYRVQEEECQFLLTNLCLTTMSAELRFNICDLETSCLANKAVPDIETKVANGISSLLSYSCLFWATHLFYAPFDDTLMGAVRNMVLDKLLYWFEAMSLLEGIDMVLHSLSLALRWSDPSPNDEFKDFIRDACQFINAFFKPISHSAPHVYISALPLAPLYSSVAQRFLPRFPNLFALSTGKSTHWSPCIFTSENHRSVVESIAFSPNEEYFVSGSRNGAIYVCDSVTGNRVAGPFQGPSEVTCVFFEPDCPRIWASFADGFVAGWDIITGTRVLSFKAGTEPNDIIGCYYFDGGPNIVTVSILHATVTLWSSDTGERLRDLLTETPVNRCPCCARLEYPPVSFSPDGSYMAWGAGVTVRIWKLTDGNEIRGPSHSQPLPDISALSFANDGHFVVSGSISGSIMIWDAETGHIIGRPLATGRGAIRALAYSHQHKMVVAAFKNPDTIMVWNTVTHDVIQGPLEGHTSRITSIALSQDGRRVLSASADRTVKMWNIDRDGILSVPSSSMTEYAGPVSEITFSPRGRKFASIECRGEHGRIRVWDVNTGNSLLTIDSTSHLQKIIFSPDGRWIVAFVDLLEIWSATDGALVFSRNLQVFTDHKHADMSIMHLAFRSIDQRWVTCSRDGTVRTWNLQGNTIVGDQRGSSPQPEDPSRRVQILALSPDGQTAVVHDGGKTPCSYLWSTTTFQPLPVTFGHIPFCLITYSPSGKFFTAAYHHYHTPHEATTLKVWDTQTGEPVRISRIQGQLLSIAFFPDERHIASSHESVCGGCNMPAIRVHNFITGAEVLQPWRRHTDSISALVFSPDGEKMVSGSRDGQIRIWDTAELLGQSEASRGFLGVGKHIQNGWVMDADRNLLFWVPKERRPKLVWPGYLPTIGGNGIETELDLTNFKYGKDWAECVGA